MPGTAAVGGLISGLDTNSILEQLYELARAPIRRLEARKTQLTDQSAAWSALEGKLLGFKMLATQLSSQTAFLAHIAASSHPNLTTATASTSAVPGSYIIAVQQLAQTHQEISGGYADTSETEFGVGTVSVEVGEVGPTVIQTEGLTLAELRDAINAAEVGVSAAIINEGSGGTPYRLVVTSQTSGLAGAMEVVSTGAAPTFSDLQAAQDAQIVLGSPGVTISSGSNTVTDAIPGLSLQLLAADPATQITLTVSQDTVAVQSAITSFVDSYNDLVGFFADQFYYDPDTNQAGILFADFRLQSLQQDLGAALTSEVIGLSAGFRSLSQLGIRTDSTGRLVQDSAAVLAGLTSSLDDVAKLFAAVGEATDSSVTYLSATAETQPSGASAWAVEITQAARRAEVVAGVAQTDTLLEDEILTIQGVNIPLTAGMSADDVAGQINEYVDQTGVAASRSDGKLTLTRVAYGASYHIEAVSDKSNQGAGGGRTSGIGTVTVTDEQPEGESGTGTGQTGLDVEGKIGGTAATGVGQRLTATEGDPKGLSLLVTADAPGSYGEIIFTVGAAEAGRRVALSATEIVDGTIAASQDRLSDLIGDIDEEVAGLEALIEQEQERLRASFTRMERALGQLQSQSQFLASQIALMQLNAAGYGG